MFSCVFFPLSAVGGFALVCFLILILSFNLSLSCQPTRAVYGAIVGFSEQPRRRLFINYDFIFIVVVTKKKQKTNKNTKRQVSFTTSLLKMAAARAEAAKIMEKHVEELRALDSSEFFFFLLLSSPLPSSFALLLLLPLLRLRLCYFFFFFFLILLLIAPCFFFVLLLLGLAPSYCSSFFLAPFYCSSFVLFLPCSFSVRSFIFFFPLMSRQK